MWPRLGSTGLVAAAIFTYAGIATPTPIVSVIPVNCRAVVVFHHLRGIDGKIRGLEKRLNVPGGSDPLQNMQAALGITGGLNENGSAALVFMAPPAGRAPTATKAVVGVLPALNFGALHQGFEAGKPRHGIAAGTTPNGRTMYLADRAGYLLLAPQRPVLREFLAQTRPLGAALPPAYRRAIAANDISVYLNIPMWRRTARTALRHLRALTGLIGQTQGANTAATLGALRLESRAIEQVLAGTNRLLMTVRRGRGGLTLQAMADFQPGTTVARLLEAQQPLLANPLIGLPKEPFLGVVADRFNGQAVADWLGTLNRPQQHGGAAPTPMAALVAGYRTAIANYTGGRAMYLPPRRRRDGLFRVISIKQCRSAPQAMAQIAQMTRLALPQNLGGAGYTVTIASHAIRIGGVAFTRIKVGLRPKNLPSEQAALVQQMLALLFGGDSLTIYAAPISATEILESVGVNRHDLAAALASARRGQDPLDQLRSTHQWQRHLLPHPNFILAFALGRWVSLLADRLQRALQDGEAVMPAPRPAAVVQGGPETPVVASAAVVGDRMRIKAYLPTSTLLHLVDKGRELFGLILMQGLEAPPR